MKKIVFLYIIAFVFPAILQSQIGKVGINTTSPAAMLHVKDSSVAFTGVYPLPASAGNTPVSGQGNRLMWYPDKASFRAGLVTADQWNKNNIGQYSGAMGLNTVASGLSSFAVGEYNVASGHTAMAGGWNNLASGEGAFAFGSGTYSTSFNSFTIGISTRAISEYTFASGNNTKAAGPSSSTFGFRTQANGYASIVIGLYNDTIVAPQNAITNTTPLFIIGNGTASVRSNAMTVLKNGKIGINTTVPSAQLHVKDSSVVFTGPATLPASPGNPPISNAGTRLMWYPDKGAFRAGRVGADEWNKNNTGNYSVAFGYDCIASGSTATALGFNNVSSGTHSVAFGESNIASGFNATAWGNSCHGKGSGASSFGYNTQANGYYSTVIGMYNDTIIAAQNIPSSTTPLFIIGNGSTNTQRTNALTVLKNGNIGIGTTTPGFPITFPNSTGDKISLFGQSGTSYGFGIQNNLFQIHAPTSADDIVFGYGSSASLTEAMRIKGNGNVGIGTSSPQYLLDLDARMRIRSGGNASTSPGIWFNKIDNSGLACFIGLPDENHVGIFSQVAGSWQYFMDLNNGEVGIGTFPSQKLHVNGNGLFNGTVTASCGVLSCSDERYKTNISVLTNTLSSLLLLQGITYEWQKEKFPDHQFNDKKQIGFSAQQLEKVFPEMVHTDDKGYKTVDYSRLTPVLVEAIKEQQTIIEDQKRINQMQQTQIDFLRSELNELKKLISGMNEGK